MKYILVFAAVFGFSFYSIKTLSSKEHWVLEKFIFLNDLMERSNAVASGRNTQLLDEILNANESDPEDQTILKSAEELRARTIKAVEILEQHKLMFIEQTGGYEEGFFANQHHIIGKMDYDGVGHYMIAVSEGGQGHGKDMKAVISEYRAFVVQMLQTYEAPEVVLDQFINLTQDAEDNPLYREDPYHAGKKWAQLSFEYLPPHTAMAYVSNIQEMLLGFETTGLEFLRAKQIDLETQPTL